MGRELCSKNSWKGNSGEKMSDQFRRRRPISRLTNQYELPGQRKPQTAKMEGEDKIFESLKRSQFDRASKHEDMYVVHKISLSLYFQNGKFFVKVQEIFTTWRRVCSNAGEFPFDLWRFLYENENMIVLISVWVLTYRDGNPLKLFTSYHSMIPHTEDALWALLLELPRKTTYMKMEIK